MIFNGNIYSKFLEQDTRLTIVGPNPKANKPYKVAYVLHPLCCISETWCEFTRLPFYARHYNTLCILPEVNRSFYTDQKIGQKYFSYVSRELPQIVKGLFNISDKREDTSVFGASMGAYGALKLVLTLPEKYSFCAVSSAAFLFLKADIAEFVARSKKEMALAWGAQFEQDLKAMFGTNLETSENDEIISLMEKAPCGSKPEIFHCCGTKDKFYPANKAFSEIVKEWGAYKYTFEDWAGGHDWDFFDEFIKKAFAYRYKADRRESIV